MTQLPIDWRPLFVILLSELGFVLPNFGRGPSALQTQAPATMQAGRQPPAPPHTPGPGWCTAPPRRAPVCRECRPQTWTALRAAEKAIRWTWQKACLPTCMLALLVTHCSSSSHGTKNLFPPQKIILGCSIKGIYICIFSTLIIHFLIIFNHSFLFISSLPLRTFRTPWKRFHIFSCMYSCACFQRNQSEPSPSLTPLREPVKKKKLGVQKLFLLYWLDCFATVGVWRLCHGVHIIDYLFFIKFIYVHFYTHMYTLICMYNIYTFYNT